MGHSPREGAGAEGAECSEQGDARTGAARGEAAAGGRGLVAEADIGLAEEEGSGDIA